MQTDNIKWPRLEPKRRGSDGWSRGAARCYVSREFFKHYGYLVLYGWDADPWLRSIILEEVKRSFPVRRQHGVS